MPFLQSVPIGMLLICKILSLTSIRCSTIILKELYNHWIKVYLWFASFSKHSEIKLFYWFFAVVFDTFMVISWWMILICPTVVFFPFVNESILSNASTLLYQCRCSYAHHHSFGSNQCKKQWIWIPQWLTTVYFWFPMYNGLLWSHWHTCGPRNQQAISRKNSYCLSWHGSWLMITDLTETWLRK